MSNYVLQTAMGGSLPTIIDGNGLSILALHETRLSIGVTGKPGLFRTPVFADPAVAQRVLALLNTTEVEYGLTWEVLTYADAVATERTVWEPRQQVSYSSRGDRDVAYLDMTEIRRGTAIYRNVRKTRRVVLPVEEEWTDA